MQPACAALRLTCVAPTSCQLAVQVQQSPTALSCSSLLQDAVLATWCLLHIEATMMMPWATPSSSGCCWVPAQFPQPWEGFLRYLSESSAC